MNHAMTDGAENGQDSGAVDGEIAVIITAGARLPQHAVVLIRHHHIASRGEGYVLGFGCHGRKLHNMYVQAMSNSSRHCAAISE